MCCCDVSQSTFFDFNSLGSKHSPTMEKSTENFSAMQLIFMIIILLRQVADRLGVIISPVELLSEAANGGFLAASANDWSTLGSALLATDERLDDPPVGPSLSTGDPSTRSSGSTPTTGRAAPSVPSSGGKGTHGKGNVGDSRESWSDDEESESSSVVQASRKRQRRE